MLAGTDAGRGGGVSLRRGIGVGVKGVTGSDAIVALETLKNKGICLPTSSSWELLRYLLRTIAPPCVNYRVSSCDPFYSDPDTPPISQVGVWGGFCCSAPQYGWGRGGEEGHAQERAQERTRECCAYPLAL